MNPLNGDEITPDNASKRMAMKNLESLIRVMGGLRSSRFLDMKGCICCDNGTDSANENYALLDPESAPRDAAGARVLVREALDFFAETDRPHVWHVPDGISGALTRELETAGARWEDELTVMAAEAGYDVITHPDGADLPYELENAREAREWADAVWLGFDSGCPAPPSFVMFAEGMLEADGITLFAVRSRLSPDFASEITATGLLVTSSAAAGIYYVSTRPDFRRRGLGMSIMKVMMSRSRAAGYDKITLLATPSGYPLYRRCGFRVCGSAVTGVFGEK
jgi:ribosomal protein S18 acetylase RimI-like enzyme